MTGSTDHPNTNATRDLGSGWPDPRRHELSARILGPAIITASCSSRASHARQNSSMGKPAGSHSRSRLGRPLACGLAKPSPGPSTGPKHDKRPHEMEANLHHPCPCPCPCPSIPTCAPCQSIAPSLRVVYVTLVLLFPFDDHYRRRRILTRIGRLNSSQSQARAEQVSQRAQRTQSDPCPLVHLLPRACWRGTARTGPP